MTNKTNDVPEKIENSGAEKLKKHFIWLALAYIVVLALLSYFQIDKDHSWLENMLSNISEVFGHIASFAGLVVVFGVLYMEHIKDTIKKGFGVIGKAVADEMKNISSEAKKASEAVQNNFSRPKPASYSEGDDDLKKDTEIEKNIGETVKTASAYAKAGNFDAVREKWLASLNQNPKEIKLLEMVIEFYSENEHMKGQEKEALKIIQSAHDKFKGTPEFYRVLALAYVNLRGIDVDAKENAIKAVDECLKLDKDNPKWIRTLGYIHYWFGNTEQAINITEKALQKAESLKAGKDIADTKNNLSFYYAMKGSEKSNALKYAKEALAYFKQHEDNKTIAMAYDTLGYVQHKFYSTLGDLEEALGNFRQAGILDPNKVDYFQHQQDVQKTINKIALPEDKKES